MISSFILSNQKGVQLSYISINILLASYSKDTGFKSSHKPPSLTLTNSLGSILDFLAVLSLTDISKFLTIAAMPAML